MTLTPDNKLTTVADISARIATIRKNREIECDKSPQRETATSFKNRQNRITKLTERESALLMRLFNMRKGA